MYYGGCKDCSKRVLGCHATCETYINYKKELEKAREIRESVKEHDRYFLGKQRENNVAAWGRQRWKKHREW